MHISVYTLILHCGINKIRSHKNTHRQK
ncbi:hypothetical protein PITCH_A2290003 [uncultured Desulfobacterium sp.]|uniref:Uncharacterized protein n=1 Tax=uncultured Desulfobacterium sp. TaxID=201089 RepID=A0A445MXQ9_9BACT|nr:hypothetical protein PITCH_A2290003 [uncultured Desulfobacterium sp.]